MSTFGPAYDKKRDVARTSAQMERIRKYMLASKDWQTLDQISAGLVMLYEAHFPAASVSAQLRHLKRPEHGGYILDKRYIGNGLWAYKLSRPAVQQTLLDIPQQHWRDV